MESVKVLSALEVDGPADSREVIWVKRGIWLYFWLLILEGALRKWIVPQLSSALLVVRDPIVIFIYWKAYTIYPRPRKPTLIPFAVVSFALIVLAGLQLMFDLTTAPIIVYGLRSYLLHLPLIIVIARTMDSEDAKKLGYWILVVSIPLAMLMAVQYYSSPTSWINIGAGGGGEDGFEHLDLRGIHARPPGTFSSVSGIECFVPCVVAYLLYAFAHPGVYPRLLVWGAAISTITAIPLSISRTVWFMTAAVIAWTVLAGLTSIEYSVRLVRIAAVLLIAVVLASQTPVFRDALGTAVARWNSAGEGDTKDVIVLRVLDPFLEGFKAMDDQSFLGRGIGSGSNVASVLQTGRLGFGVAEWEWPRIMLECGPLGGLIFLGFRAGLCIYILLVTLRGLRSTSELGCSLAAAFVPTLLTKTIEQPTNLGFMALGLCLAAASQHYRRRALRLTLSVDEESLRCES